MANIFDIAKMAGVSKTTVSKVLNNQYGVNEATRQRVLTAVKELNYTPNHAARSLVTNRTGVIGVIYDSFSMPIYIELAEYLEFHAEKNNYNVVFCNCNDNYKTKTKYINYFEGGAADGIVLFGSDKTDKDHIVRLKSLHYPLVVIENHFDDLDMNNILINNLEGARNAVKYLAGLGHGKIAHITGNVSHHVASDRLNGYICGLQECGLEFVPEFVIYTDAKRGSGSAALESLLKKSIKPTAIFTFNDIQAFEAVSSLHKHSLKVPEDFSVVGFDNITRVFDYIPHRITLTSMAQPIEEIARASIELLLENIEKKDMQPRRMVFETSLFIGKSCSEVQG